MINRFIQLKNPFPCLNCTERKVGCHGKCEHYKKAAAEVQQINQTMRDEKQAGWISGHESKTATNLRRRKRNYGYTGRERIIDKGKS